MCNFALHYTPRARLTSPFIQCLPLEATFLHEFENSLNPGCCHDSLGLLMRKDSLIVWVYLIIQKGQHGTQPPPSSTRGLVVSHIHSGVLLSGGQRWEEQRGAGTLWVCVKTCGPHTLRCFFWGQRLNSYHVKKSKRYLWVFSMTAAWLFWLVNISFRIEGCRVSDQNLILSR